MVKPTTETTDKKFGFLLNKGKHLKKNTTIIRNTIKSLQENKENDALLQKRLEENFSADIARENGSGNNFKFDGKVTSHVVPDKTETYDLGSATHKFKSLYVSSNTIFIGNSSIGTTKEGGLKFPSNIQIGKSTISASASGSLTLPDTFKVGATEISTKDGGFKVGELELAALRIKGSINNTTELSNFKMTITAGDTFVFGNDLYVALIDNAKVEATDWRKIEVKGSQGIQGLKGDKGERGIQGLQGLKGDKGEQGLQGLQGLQGEKGEPGFDGSEAAEEAQRQASQAKIAAETAQIAAETAKTEALEAVSRINDMTAKILHLQNVVEYLCKQFYRKPSEEVVG